MPSWRISIWPVCICGSTCRDLSLVIFRNLFRGRKSERNVLPKMELIDQVMRGSR